MKACPNCAAENRNEAVVCYNCGRDISSVPADTVERTQPRRVQSPGTPPAADPQAGYVQQDPDQTQPGNPQGNYWPQPGDTQPGYPQQPGYTQPGYPQQGTYPAQPGYPQPGYTQPGYPPQGTYPAQPGFSGTPQGTYPAQPGYPPPNYPYQPGYPGTYPQQPGYGAPVYPPPPAPPAEPEPKSRGWPILALSLGLGLVCVCMLAVLAVTATTAGGIAGFGRQVSTQIAGVVGPTAETPQPTEPGLLPSPTSWPTLTPTESPTPQPTDTPYPTQTPVTPQPEATQAPPGGGNQPPNGAEPTPNPTQAIQIDKLLSPGCNSAMTELGTLRDEFTKSPFKLLDATWRENVSKAMGDLKANCGTLDAASPVPGEMAEVQHNLSLASAEWDTAKQLWTDGINNRDPAKIFEAGGHVTQAGKYLDAAFVALKNAVP